MQRREGGRNETKIHRGKSPSSDMKKEKKKMMMMMNRRQERRKGQWGGFRELRRARKEGEGDLCRGGVAPP